MKEKIILLLQEGKTYNEIILSVGCSKSTISYHAEKLGLKQTKYIRKDWENIQKDIDSGLPKKECSIKYGLNNNTWWKATKEGRVKLPTLSKLEKLKNKLTINSKYNNHQLKLDLIKHKILKKECSECGIKDMWNNKPISLQLDHINGIKTDNRVQNLRILCPNCHSQTETFGVKNWSYQRNIGM